ncbi:MAG: nucleotidyltransferase domain-containing protein [Formosimonas sp.]
MKQPRFGLSHAIIEQLNCVFAQYPQIEQVLIFGSRAKGNYRDSSDIDLAIIAPSMTDTEFAQLWGQLDALPLVFKLDVVHWDKLSNETLKQSSLTTGQIITSTDTYCANPTPSKTTNPSC